MHSNRTAAIRKQRGCSVTVCDRHTYRSNLATERRPTARCSCDCLAAFLRHLQELIDSSLSLSTCEIVPQSYWRPEGALQLSIARKLQTCNHWSAKIINRSGNQYYQSLFPLFLQAPVNMFRDLAQNGSEGHVLFWSYSSSTL